MLLHYFILDFYQIKFQVFGKYTSSRFPVKELLWQIKRKDTNAKSP